MSPRGASLLEVLVALVLLAVTLPGAAIGLALAHREAARAQARTRIAVALLDAVDRLQGSPPGGASPVCAALPGTGGSLPASGGVALDWRVAGAGPPRRVVLTAVLRAGRFDLADSVELRLRCG